MYFFNLRLLYIGNLNAEFTVVPSVSVAVFLVNVVTRTDGSFLKSFPGHFKIFFNCSVINFTKVLFPKPGSGLSRPFLVANLHSIACFDMKLSNSR